MRIIASQAAISIDNARLYTAQRAQLGEIATQKREVEVANAQIAEIRAEERIPGKHEPRVAHAPQRDPGIQRNPQGQPRGSDSAAAARNASRTFTLSGKHLLELVNDVLDSARSRRVAWSSPTTASACRMRSKEVHNVYSAPLSERRDIDLSIDVVPVHLEIRADKSKFKQVLYNLLSNAISSRRRAARSGSRRGPTART